MEWLLIYLRMIGNNLHFSVKNVNDKWYGFFVLLKTIAHLEQRQIYCDQNNPNDQP